MPVVTCTPHSTAILNSQLLRPDLFEFRADRGVFEDAGTDPAEDTDPVYQWSDQGPASRFATQATLASRPTLSSAAVPNYLLFDAVDDQMTFGGSTSLASTTSPWTVEAWLRLTDFTANTYPTWLTLKGSATDPIGFAFSNQINYLGLQFGSETTWARTKTDYPAASLTGAIRHIIVAYNGAGASTRTNFAAWIDGVSQTLTAAGAFSPLPNTGSVIGTDTSNAFPFKGRIYKLAGFSRVLTQAQVSARFALGVAG